MPCFTGGLSTTFPLTALVVSGCGFSGRIGRGISAVAAADELRNAGLSCFGAGSPCLGSGTGAVKLSDREAALELEVRDEYMELRKLSDTEDNASTRLLIVSYSVLDSTGGFCFWLLPTWCIAAGWRRV